MGSWIINHGFTYLILLVYFGLNAFIFIREYLFYETGEQFFYGRHLLGQALPMARSSAACLNFNCMLILLPVCRRMLSKIRGSMLHLWGRRLREQLDKNITFHKLVAFVIGFLALVHVSSHLFNAEFFNNSRRGDYDALSTALSALGDTHNTTYVNAFRDTSGSAQQAPTVFIVTSISGLTGVVSSLCIILIMTSSTPFMRRYYYEVFWYTHHLFVVFFASIIIQGIGRIVRGQLQTDPPHDYTICHNRSEEWGQIPECPVPQFRGGFPSTFQWVVFPFFLYLCERLVRFIRYMQPVQCRKIVMHQAQVLELQLVQDGFKTEVGQYIFLNCPAISRLEWHPFTLTSAPEEDLFSIHIRSSGNWTDKLISMCKDLPKGEQGPKLHVDGPFGTASEDVFDYKVCMLVGAGIGVTPFASILRSIFHKFQAGDPKLRTRKIYFYWLCRETNTFEWFADFLQILEKEMEARGMEDFLTYKLHLTNWDPSHTAHVNVHFDEATDVVTGLKQKTHYGRPNWDKEFEQVRKENPKSTVGMFLCGPEALQDVLKNKCAKYSDVDPKKTKFYFNTENF